MENVLSNVLVCLFVPIDDIAGYLGVDQAGINRVHTDAALDVFQGCRAGQAHYPMFRRDIGAYTGIASQRADGGVVDDRAAALALHLTQFMFHAAPQTAQINSDHAVPVFAGAVGCVGDAGHNSGVIKCGVKSAEVGNRALDHRGYLLVVTHIASHGDCFAPSGNELLRGGLDCFFFEVGQDDTAAPASANAFALANPIPAAAPVTSATFPLKSNGLFLK